MSHTSLSYQEITQIVELLRFSSQFSEFRLKNGDLEIEVRRGTPDAQVQPVRALPVQPAAKPEPAADTPAAPPPAAQEPATATPGKRSYAENAVLVKAPMVGTFYAAPEPGAAPFVQRGQAVRAGDSLCIIEVMKLMNTIQAECDGVVADIVVKDGMAVEYGQLLMVVEPR